MVDKVIINPAIKYADSVIPAKAGIQQDTWMPDQFRHDNICIFSCLFNNMNQKEYDHD